MPTLVGGISNPGRVYRAMHCPACEDVRFHVIDFLEVERSEQGIFVWFRRRCSGVAPASRLNPSFYKRQKVCQKAQVSRLAARQWAFFMADNYY